MSDDLIRIEEKILVVRGQRVMVDADLAEVYGVERRALNQARSRNIERFPEDFAFQLTEEEAGNLRSQSVISSSEHGGARYAPWAYTELGCLMAANVLNSPEATAEGGGAAEDPGAGRGRRRGVRRKRRRAPGWSRAPFKNRLRSEQGGSQ